MPTVLRFISRRGHLRQSVPPAVVAAAIALALIPVAQGQPSSQAGICAGGSQQAAASPTGALYVTRKPGTQLGEAESVRVFACSKQNSRRPLNVYRCAAESCALTPIAIAHCYAAFGANSGSRSPTDASTQLIRVDLCKRQVSSAFFEAAREGSNGVASSNVLAVVVKRNGSVAWTSYTKAIVNDVVQPATVEVIKQDRDGRVTLDSSPQIDGKSLALGGSHLYWLNGGAPVHGVLK